MAVKLSCKSANITVPISQIIYSAFKNTSRLIRVLLEQEDTVSTMKAVTEATLHSMAELNYWQITPFS